MHPFHAAIALATLVGAVVRFRVAVGSQVWLDEANSVLLALTPLGELGAALRPDSSPPLYYLVLKAWTFVAPLDPLSLRVPSLIMGIAAIPALAWIAWRMDRPLAGVVAAWLLALSPLHVLYSEEIRMYSMLILLALGFHFAVFRALRAGSAVPALVAGAALAYTHYYGLVYVGASLATALVVLSGCRRRVLGVGVGVGLAFLPWMPVLLAQLDNPHHVAWIQPFWASYPEGAAVLRSFQSFLPGGTKYLFVPLRGVDAQLPVVLLGGLPFVVVALRRGWRAGLGPMATALGVTVVCLGVLAVRSYVADPVYLAGRSDVVVLPLFILALAMAVSRLGAVPSALFVAAWAGLAGAELRGSRDLLRKAGNAEIAEAVAGAGCRTVVATGLTYAPVLYYQMIREDGARVVPFPIDMSEHPGNLDPARYTAGDLARDAAILAGRFPPGDGLCALGATSTFSGPLADAFVGRGARVEVVGTFQPSLAAGVPYVLVKLPDGRGPQEAVPEQAGSGGSVRDAAAPRSPAPGGGAP